MNPLLEQLKDIDGLDPISWWPLAIGWWAVITLVSILLCLIIWFVIKRIRFRRSWKNDALLKLAHLEKNLSDETSRETLILLSEYLRRIALKRFSRKECAGLKGKLWLKWLSKRDPQNFDWEQKGVLLINAPYAPLKAKCELNEIVDLIQALRGWIVNIPKQ